MGDAAAGIVYPGLIVTDVGNDDVGNDDERYTTVFGRCFALRVFVRMPASGSAALCVSRMIEVFRCKPYSHILSQNRTKQNICDV